MKKLIQILGVALLFVIFLSGCSNSTTKKDSTSKNDSGIVGKTYKANTQIENASHGKVTIHFAKDNKALLIESGKFEVGHQWGQLVFNAKYKLLKNKKIKITTFKEATTENYKNESAMKDGSNPIFIDPTKLDKDRKNHVELAISNNSMYAGHGKNKVKFVLTDNNGLSDYDSYMKDKKKKYYGKDTKLSDRGFMSPATEMLSNEIAFKGSRFIWKFGGPDNEFSSDNEQGARLAIFMGKYKLRKDRLTLYIQYHSSIFQGTISQLSSNQYQDKLTGSDVPKKLVFKFTKNNRLHLMINSNDFESDDMLDYGTVDGTPNYNKLVKNNQPDVYTVAMEKASNSGSSFEENNNANTNNSTESVTDIFPTKEDFVQWLTNFYAENDSLATEENSGFWVTGSSQGGTAMTREGADDEQIDTPIVYSVSYAYTVLNDDSDISRTIYITPDGKLYSGHFNVYDEDLTSAYAEYAANK